MFEWKKSAGKIYTLPVESIHPSPFQARTVFDEKELAGLAQSIRENGLLQPISVRKVEGGYELVAGERVAGQQVVGLLHAVRQPLAGDVGFQHLALRLEALIGQLG